MTDSLVGDNSAGANAVRQEAGVLPRRLGTTSLAIMIVAFCCPIATMAGSVQLTIGFGNGVGAPLSFLVVGAVLLIFSAGFLGMTPFVKKPGAFYSYIAEGLGKPAGLAFGLVACCAYLLFVAGVYAYLGHMVVETFEHFVGEPVGSWQLWALGAAVIITILSLLRIDLSMRILGVLVLVECALVAVWQGAIMIKGGPEGYSLESFTPSAFMSGSVGLGLLFAIATVLGVEVGAVFRDEVRNPEKSVARATYIGLAFCAVFYAFGCWVYIIAQGPLNVVETAATDPLGSFLGSIGHYAGAWLMDVTIVVLLTSQMAGQLALQGAASRYLHALGRDGVLSQKLACVHPTLKSPYVAVLTVTVITGSILILVWISGAEVVRTYGSLMGVASFFLLPLLVATSIAVIAFFRRHPELKNYWWVSWGAPVFSAIGVTVFLLLALFNFEVLVPTRVGTAAALLGLVALIAGGFALARWYETNRPDVYERIGNQ